MGREGAGLEANTVSFSGHGERRRHLISPGLPTQHVFHQKLLEIWSSRRIKAAPYLGLQRVQPLGHVGEPRAVHAF